MQCHDILAELEVVGQLVGAGKVGEEVDDVLLLAGEVLRKLVATLLELLLSSELDGLLAFLRDVFGRGLALAGYRLARDLALQRWRSLGGRALELVNTLHVVEEVVAAREAVSRDSTLTVLEVAQVRSGTVSVHAVGLTLVTEQAGGGRELNTDAGLLVAAEWLQVRVNILVVVALQRCGLVGAAGLALLGAVVFAVLVGTLLVKGVAASNLGALLLKLSLGCVCG